MTGEHSFRLVGPPPSAAPPRLDADQQRVIDHPGGPLLVLAGPGTGKTTTLVEAIVERIENRGLDPDQVLALTFSRKAAEQLRTRVTSRLGRTMSDRLAWTFHSFAYGLVRRYQPAELYEGPLSLLSAPEQDVVIAQLLQESPEAVRWPEGFRAAVRTRGFARELQALLARARERGLDAADLARLGEASGHEEYAAAGSFMEQYLTVLDSQGAIDYADLIGRAVGLAHQHRDELRGRFRVVFVDEYQDTDPAQVALLRAIAGDGRDLVVVGDPDQSIYGFRGADVGAILDFPRAFPQGDGRAAPVIALRATRRYGSGIARATSRISAGIGVSGAIDADQFRTFRSPRTDPDRDPGVVAALTFETARAEAENIADLLRRAHLEDGMPWDAMAVLVRSGRATIPSLRRSLVAAGVPVEVASDDTPLVREPAVLPLLAALQAVVHAEVADPADPHYLQQDQVADLVTSPVGGLDATDLRGVYRGLRQEEVRRAAAAGEQPQPSRGLLRRAVLEPDFLDSRRSDETLSGVRRLARLLARARKRLLAGASAEEVLWILWSGTPWGARLQAATRGGGAAARYAHRDLDALCALFDEAARAEVNRGHTSVENFLETLAAQEIPSDNLSETGVRAQAVRLLTAHRAKGLEWRLVVVAHVQEAAWPDLRTRGSLLRAERIGREGLTLPATTREQLAEERRLFYVACTRARERLIVTAVSSPDDDGEQPSRFLREIGVDVAAPQGRPERPLTVAGLVAELRRTAAAAGEPTEVRHAAADRLAFLAGQHLHGRAVARTADPAYWWGLRDPSHSPQPLREPDEPVQFSASTLQAIVDCPTKWFLTREAGGERVTSQSQGFGLIVHALAQRLAEPGSTIDEATVTGLIDEVWDQMEFRTPWSRDREREAIADALRRYLTWRDAARGRSFVATEAPLDAEVRLPDGQTVRLHGYADRLELDHEGRVVVVDLKTGKYAPTKGAVSENPQLGLYQLAVNAGAANAVAGGEVISGGAELVFLRLGAELPEQRDQPAARPGAGSSPVEEQLQAANDLVRSEQLEVRPSTSVCRTCDFQEICPAFCSGTVLS